MSEKQPATSPTLLWTADRQDPARADLVRTALREVCDPEIGLNVIELGLVREVEFQPDKNNTHIRMILTTPFCPYGPAMLEMTRRKVAETTGGEATIELGLEAWQRSMMEDGAGSNWGIYQT